jgi:secreted PhoX family phosphatase
MRFTRVRLVMATAIVLGLATAAAVVASGASDFGLKQEHRLNAQANQLFGGIGKPLGATAAQASGTEGAASVKLASKLKVTAVLRGDVNGPDTAKLFQNADMIAFWPSDDVPVWGIVCIESGPTAPGVQRIKLAGVDRGKVETILTGTRSCDGIRRTPWQTILASEEVGTEDGVPGWAIEIYDPLNTDSVVFDRTTGAVSGADAANVKPRPALGRFAWEGIEILPDGTLYAGDELAPINRANGGAIFKFVSSSPPAQPLTAATIAFLSNPANHASSPFAAGTLSALRVGGTGSNYGQGNQRGLGTWIGPITATDARASAEASGATGYYRPEDLQFDPLALADGQVRFCWTDTGVASLQNFGEVLCAEETASGPVVQTFVEGSNLMNQPDNLAFQPETGVLYVIEDNPRVNGVSVAGDIWACLPDGGDVNLQTDGCVPVVSVTTAGSEPTGFIFDQSGQTAYLNIQHSPNIASTPIDESRYDELLVIEGFMP